MLQKGAVKLKRVSTSSSQNDQKLRGKYEILKKPLMNVGSNDVPRSVLFFFKYRVCALGSRFTNNYYKETVQ